MITSPRLKRYSATLTLFAVSTAGALLLAEGLVRIVAPQRLESHRPIYEADSVLVYRLKKNYDAVYSQPEFQIHERTNELGLRDRPIGPRPPGTLRILGLGDSFSYSNSVNLEETYFKQLEGDLSGTRPAEVINAAVPAYTTLQEYRYLERDGIRLEPDVVLLGFYVGNDFQDSYELMDSLGRPTIDVEDGQLRSNDRFPSARYDRQERTLRTATMSLRAFFASNSALYVFLRERFSESLWRMGLRNNPPPPDFCARTFSPSMEAGWETTQGYLQRFADLTRSKGIRLILLALPTQYQVHEELWKHHFTTFGLDPREYDLEKPQALLREFCLTRGIEYVDVLPALRARAADHRLFYPIASYMTPVGHRIVASEIAAYLQRTAPPGGN
jgi:hypothetical protein